MSIHIIFESGSNPYVRYNMTPEEFAKEIPKWSKNYDLKYDHVFGESIIQFVAKEKQ